MSSSPASADSPPSAGTNPLGLVFGSGVLDRLPNLWAWIVSVVLLAPRVYLAVPFWNAGQARIDSWAFQATLFETVHPLPLLPPTVAAYVTTGFELLLPILLILGLFGRFAALGLAVMAATIYFVIGGAFAIPSEQFPWMAVGLLLFIVGPGRLSVDEVIRRRFIGS